MFKRVKDDIQMVFDQDPAARSSFEVVMTYSGLHAIWSYLIANWFFKKNVLYSKIYIPNCTIFHRS